MLTHRSLLRIAWLPLALALASPAGAQRDRTDEFIEAQMKQQRIPGLSVVVIKDGAIVKAKGYGVVSTKTRTPANEETVYQIGSVSKQFIATGIMLLVQEGRLKVDDPASKYLADAPSA